MDIWSLLPLIAGLLAAGFIGGIMAGLLGVGGGIVMVPAMGLAFEFMGYDAEVYHHVAVGTSLAIIISTGYISARAHFNKGVVLMDVLKVWGPFIMVAALLGGLSARIYSGDALRLIFGGVAVFLALNVVLPIQKRLMSKLGGSGLTNRITAAFVGYISALMGIGGGSLSVPTLAAFGNPMHKAVGTGAALGVLIAIPSAIGFVVSGWTVEGRPPLSLGYVNVPALLIIGLSAGLAAPLGAALAHKLEKAQLERAFAVFLLLVGLRMLWQAIA